MECERPWLGPWSSHQPMDGIHGYAALAAWYEGELHDGLCLPAAR